MPLQPLRQSRKTRLNSPDSGFFQEKCPKAQKAKSSKNRSKPILPSKQALNFPSRKDLCFLSRSSRANPAFPTSVKAAFGQFFLLLKEPLLLCGIPYKKSNAKNRAIPGAHFCRAKKTNSSLFHIFYCS